MRFSKGAQTLWTGLTTIGKGIVCYKSHSVYLKKLWEEFETQQSTHIPTDQQSDDSSIHNCKQILLVSNFNPF